MATLPSRRDSNRTQAAMIRLLAKRYTRTTLGVKGMTEDEFVSQFNSKYADLARKIYREVQQ